MADPEIRLRARNETKAAFAEITASAQKLQGTLAALGVGISVAGIVEYGRKALDMVANLESLSKQARVSVEFLDQLRQVAQRTGQQFEPLSSAVGRFSTELAKARGGDPALVKMFQNLGISAKELKDARVEDIFQKVVLTLGSASNEATAGAYSIALMGKSARELAPIFDDIARRGLPVARVTAQMADEAEKAQIEFRKLAAAFEAGQIFWGGAIAERINATADALRNVTGGAIGLIAVWPKLIDIMLHGGELGQAQAEIEGITNKILEIRKKLSDVRPPPGIMGEEVGRRQTDALKKQLEEQERLLQGATARMNVARGLTPDGQPKPLVFPPNAGPAPKIPDIPGTTGAQGPQFKDFLRSLQEELTKTAAEGNKVAQVEAEIISGARGPANAAQAANAISLASQINQRESLTRAIREQADALRTETAAEASFNLTEGQRLDAAAEKWKQFGDSSRAFYQNLQEIQRLEERGVGGLTTEQALLATRKLREEYDAQHNALSQLKDDTIDVKDASRDLGLVFSSAMGQAIAEGAKLSDILQGILRDILQIITRITIERPLEKALENIIPNIAQWFTPGAPVTEMGRNYIPTYQSGTDYVPKTGLAMLHRGERVVPASENSSGGVTINVLGAQGPVTARRREDPMGGVTLDLVVGHISQQQAADIGSGRGALPAILERTYGLSRVPGSVR